MTDIQLTAAEVAQVHLRLWRIQKEAGSKSTKIYNQARLLLLLFKKAERRQAKAKTP
jgi:hypothetical protein